jgi:pimeloyl-ACP methyl ester carboxylesterase
LASMARHLGEAPDFTADLAKLEIPIAVVRGEHDDAWPHDVQDRLAEALHTRVVVIPDAAHSPAWEQPEQTRDALVRAWMR